MVYRRRLFLLSNLLYPNDFTEDHISLDGDKHVPFMGYFLKFQHKNFRWNLEMIFSNLKVALDYKLTVSVNSTNF